MKFSRNIADLPLEFHLIYRGEGAQPSIVQNLNPQEDEEPLDQEPACVMMVQIWTVGLDTPYSPRASCLFKKWRLLDWCDGRWDMHL